MISFLKHIKGSAYFLATFLLFQSCLAYNKNSSTIEEAFSEKDMPVKIITVDGNKYTLRWFEEMEGNLVSMKNVKREYLNKKEIVQIVLLDPAPHVVSLDLAVKHHGTFQLLTKDDKNRYNSHKFIRLSENDEIITGYKMKGKDTLTVIIPTDQIEMIQLKDKNKSSNHTTGLVAGVALGVGIIVLGAVMANNLSFWYD